MMNFQGCQSNQSLGETKLHNKEVVISRFIINFLFFFNHILRIEKTKEYFIQLKNQHFKFINVGFFLNDKKEHH
jgi:hypothetical protein